MEAKLRSYGDLFTLVFGAWGEASADVHALVSALADVGMHRHYKSMRMKGPLEARSVLVWMLRRRWGMTALRENAHLLLARLEYVGRGAMAAAARRDAASGDAAVRARRAACAARLQRR